MAFSGAFAKRVKAAVQHIEGARVTTWYAGRRVWVYRPSSVPEIAARERARICDALDKAGIRWELNGKPGTVGADFVDAFPGAGEAFP